MDVKSDVTARTKRAAVDRLPNVAEKMDVVRACPRGRLVKTRMPLFARPSFSARASARRP